MTEIDPLLLPTWMIAILTAVLVLIAFVTAIYAKRTLDVAIATIKQEYRKHNAEILRLTANQRPILPE